MQKIVNVIALSSGVVSLAVVGLGVFTYVQRDQLVDNVKSRVMEAVADALPGAVSGAVPPTTGLPTAPVPPAGL